MTRDFSYCSKCGAQVADDSAFCSKCGNPLALANVPGAQAKMPSPSSTPPGPMPTSTDQAASAQLTKSERASVRHGWSLLWLRWAAWLFAFGTVFSAAAGAARIHQGGWSSSLSSFMVIALYGAWGYLIIGVITSGIVTLVCWLVIRDRPAKLWGKSTSIGLGLLIAAVVGLVLGLALGLSVAANSSLSTTIPQAISASTVAPSCTDADIEAAFQRFKSLDDAVGATKGSTASLDPRVDRFWSLFPVCTGDQTAATLSQQSHSEYIDAWLFGSADSVIVKYDGHKYSDARKYLDQYFEIVRVMQPIAEQKGWTQMLGVVKALTPVMNDYDNKLTAAGYKRAKASGTSNSTSISGVAKTSVAVPSSVSTPVFVAATTKCGPHTEAQVKYDKVERAFLARHLSEVERDGPDVAETWIGCVGDPYYLKLFAQRPDVGYYFMMQAASALDYSATANLTDRTGDKAAALRQAKAAKYLFGEILANSQHANESDMHSLKKLAAVGTSMANQIIDALKPKADSGAQAHQEKGL
jgi:hypothetical protein